MHVIALLSHTKDMLFYLKVNDLETDTEKRKRKVVKETTIDVTERYFWSGNYVVV